MSEYVPLTAEIETGFSEFASWMESKWPGTYPEAPEFAQEASSGFRRWLADHDAEVRADAWDDGWAVGQVDFECNANNPYRAQLDGPTS